MDDQLLRYELTPSQKGMADLHDFYEGTSVATLCGAVIYDEKMDRDLIDEAIRTVIARHEAIRLRIAKKDRSYIQYISEEIDRTVPHMHFESVDEVCAFGTEDGRTVFEPDGSKMYRFTVLDLPDRTGIMITMSHMIIDSWGYSLLVKEFYHAYKALSGGGEALPEARRYTDYIRRVEGYMESSARQEDIRFWTERYGNGLSKGSIGRDTGEDRSVSSSRYVTDISYEVSAKMKVFTEQYRSSAPVMFEAAVLIYLARISRVGHNVTIGTPVLGRSGMSEKETVGMFMSTIPLSVDVGPDDTALSLIERISRAHRSIFRHARLSHEEIAKSIRSSCGHGGWLYDILVNYQNSTIDVPGETIWFSTGCTEVPLAIHIDDRDGNGCYRINADHQLASFPDEGEIALIIRRIEYIISQMADDPNMKVKDISLIPPAEERFLVEEYNDTTVPYRKELCIHEIFSDYAAGNADSTAVVFRDREYTYGDLDRMSDALAAELITRGIGKGDIVPIISGRSHYIPVAMLAVLKSGAAYMPVSPDYPKSRIELMLKTTGARHALVYGADTDLVEYTDLEIFDYTDRDYVRPNASPDDLCYVIFTSGSTGDPKATAVTHKNVVNYCSCNNVNVCGKIISEEDKSILSVTNIVFDIFVTESLLALTNGIRMILADDDEVMSGGRLARLMSDADIIQTTPTKMRSYLTDKDFRSGISSIKKIMLGGEELTPALLSDLRSYTDAKIFNVYGPAETTVWSSVTYIEDNDITIGRPIANTQIYILDEAQSLCPVGVTGEITISGDGVGRGYINNEELTSVRFIPDPFRPGNTMYRTGDMGRMRPDGNIEFCGRRDNQIKLRGLRIELGEIECAMARISGVDLSAVACRKDLKGEAYLAAFYTSEQDVGEQVIRESLLRDLPSYMVPKVIRKIDKMPMTASGKIDRKALPEVSIDISGREYIAPSTDTQEKIVAIMEDILKIDRISVTDDFFDIGGDSFAAMEFVSEASESGIELAVKDLYSARNALALESMLKVPSTGVQPGEDRDLNCYPLSLKRIDRIFFKAFSFFTRHGYDLKVEGLENIDPSSKYIFCPNHETMADPLWVWTALRMDGDPGQIATVAAEEFLNGTLSRMVFRAQGGIPVDRRGDFTGALRRAESVIRDERRYLLIHPEGTRTRTGEIGEFKKGAAVIAAAVGVDIVPVCITGAGKIYPIGRRFPKLLGRYPLTIKFGHPVSCEGKTSDEIMRSVKESILSMR